MGAFLTGKNHKGYTLIECLTTLIILSVAFLGLFAMALGTIRGQALKSPLGTATVLARQRLEQIKHADYATVVAANYPPEPYQTMAGFEAFQRTVEITDGTPDPNMKTIMVTVSWREPDGVARQVSLHTLIVQ